VQTRQEAPRIWVVKPTFDPGCGTLVASAAANHIDIGRKWALRRP
jgi:hypothetical protein